MGWVVGAYEAGYGVAPVAALSYWGDCQLDGLGDEIVQIYRICRIRGSALPCG